MASRISYNIHAQFVSNHDRLIQHLKAINPVSVLVMDGLGLAREIKQELPTCLVINRIYPDDDIHNRMSPEDWIRERAPQAEGGIFQYTTNESGFSPALIDWHIRLCNLAIAENVPLLMVNTSVGTPQPEEWANGRQLLELMDQHRHLFVMGLHSYACGVITSGFIGGYPSNAGVPPGQGGGVNLIPSANWPTREAAAPMDMYHCGRFKFLVQYCNSIGLRPPRIILSEHGFDDVSDVKGWSQTLIMTPPYTSIRGWRSIENQWRAWYEGQGWSSQRAMFEQLTYADKTIYQDSPVEAQLLFCWARPDNSDWEQFDLSDASEFQALLEQYAATGTPPDTGDGGEEIPVGKIDLHPYFRGDGRWYDLNHNQQMGGGWETVSTQGEAADARIFLHQKNSQYERMCLHNGFICRDLDTSPGNNEAYRLTDGSTAWSKWCPQFMAVGEKYQRNPTVTFLNKSNGSPVASKPPYVDHSTIQLEKVWTSYPIPENTAHVIADVIQLAFFPAGATVATERYFYAKKYGLIRWAHNDGRVSFIQHLTTTTTPLPTIEQLGAWANPPIIPPESNTQPPSQSHEFPPANDPGWTMKEVAPNSNYANVRAQPTTNSADIGDITAAHIYNINETKAVPDPQGTWIPIVGEWGNGWVASWVITITEEVVIEPPPIDPPPPDDKPVTLTLSLKVLAPPGTDPVALEATLKGLVLVIGEAAA